MALPPNGSTRLTLLPTSYLANLPPDSEVTLNALVETQDRLADEAREAMPYAFDECSYEKGYVRQSVWSCIEHKLIELWTRRHFRCDCPTDCPPSSSRPAKRSKCTLNPPSFEPRPINDENKYNQNYKGEFCRCGRPYDPETEKEGMLCCIGCEDWFHESCLNLRPPGTAPNPGVEPKAEAEGATPPPPTTSTPGEDEDDEYDEDGALIRSDTYDGLVCAACVEKSPLLKERAGSKGYMAVVPNSEGVYEVIGTPELNNGTEETQSSAPPTPLATEQSQTNTEDVATGATIAKRPLEDGEAEGAQKKQKTETTTVCKGKGDIFLADGVREALRIELSTEEQAKLPFPLIDEEIYEPPADAEPEETLEEVTDRVVGSMPRVNAIEALHGYQRIRDGLRAMLQTHAQDGRVVSREDIESMFEGLRGATA